MCNDGGGMRGYDDRRWSALRAIHTRWEAEEQEEQEEERLEVFYEVTQVTVTHCANNTLVSCAPGIPRHTMKFPARRHSTWFSKYLSAHSWDENMSHPSSSTPRSGEFPLNAPPG